MRHVTVGKAIDWQQWQLDQAVRSVRMQVDHEGDLYAIPVIVVDPTKELTVTGLSAPAPWYGYGTMQAAMTYITFNTPIQGRSSWITKISIDFANATILGGAQNQFFVQTNDGLTQLFRTWQYFPAALPNPPRPTVIWDFGAHPIAAGPSGCGCGMTGDMDALTQIAVHCWGYDV